MFRVLNQYLHSACRLSWVSQFDGIFFHMLMTYVKVYMYSLYVRDKWWNLKVEFFFFFFLCKSFFSVAGSEKKNKKQKNGVIIRRNLSWPGQSFLAHICNCCKNWTRWLRDTQIKKNSISVNTWCLSFIFLNTIPTLHMSYVYMVPATRLDSKSSNYFFQHAEDEAAPVWWYSSRTSVILCNIFCWPKLYLVFCLLWKHYVMTECWSLLHFRQITLTLNQSVCRHNICDLGIETFHHYHIAVIDLT